MRNLLAIGIVIVAVAAFVVMAPWVGGAATQAGQDGRTAGGVLDGMASTPAALPGAVAAPTALPTLAVARLEGVDGTGLAWTAEGFGGLAFTAVGSGLTLDGRLRIVGEVTNAGAAPAQFILVAASLFDGQGRIVGTEQGTLDLDPLAAGATSSFDVLTRVEPGDVARYVLRVQP